MSHIKELQQLIQTDKAIAGRVISVSDTGVIVATTSGQIEVLANGDLYVGDLVTISSDRATKKQREQESYPMYWL
jgi:hypothetical protein